ncbi:AAA family ATPase [Rhizobium herbae]
MKPHTQDMLDAAIENLLTATAEVRLAISKFPAELSRRAAPTALASSPRRFLAFCAFVHLMKNQQHFFTSETSVIVIQVPRAWPMDDFDYVAELGLKSGGRSSVRIKAFCHPPRTKKGNWDFSPGAYLDAQKVVVFLPKGAELHAEFRISADTNVDLDILADRHLDSLARQLDVGPLSEECKALLRQLDPRYIDSIFRKGRSARSALARVKELSSKASSSRRVLPLTSYGAAGTWGLDLKRDLELWRAGALHWADVDKGVLLYGSPGTGKTSFAISLASECGAHLVAASLAKWQSHGHLGDLLKAMRLDFNEARESAPSILFLDEFDAFGDRRKFSGDNQQYCSEVVNALLEALDGAGGREGVVVVASTNLPERLDPALIRSGRLEKHIDFLPPNAEERASILRFYLPELADFPAIRQAAGALVGKTGADLELLARKARQRARVANRSLMIEDLTGYISERVKLVGADLWRICIHEAAHAVVARVLEVGIVSRIEIFDHTSENERSHETHGATWIDEPVTPFRTERYFRAEIAMGLAGMAAEELVFGYRSTTAGGSPRSDVAKATELASQMVTRFGLGRRLSTFPEEINKSAAALFPTIPDLRADVDLILDAEYKRSREILESNQDTLVKIAGALRDEKSLAGERLATLLNALPDNEVLERPQVQSDTPERLIRLGMST